MAAFCRLCKRDHEGGYKMRESQKRANEKWLAANYEKITIRVPKGTKDEIKKAASLADMSMAQFIVAACKEKAEKTPF